jgi:HEAT repeat protein
VAQARHRLDSSNAVRRARAAAFLGNVGDEDSVQALCEALHDAHPDVRSAAARALGNVGRPEAAAALLGTLGAERGSPDAVQAGTIVSALLSLGPTAAPAALAAARSASATRQAMAIETLGLLGHVPAAGVLIGLLATEQAGGMEVRTRSARALGRIGSPQAVPVLAEILGGDHPWPLRAVSAKALGEIGAASAVEALYPLLNDPEAVVVVNVARALASTAEGRARLVPVALTAPAAGIIPAQQWALYQPAVAAAEALAAVGQAVEAEVEHDIREKEHAITIDREHATVVGLHIDLVAAEPEELTVKSPPAREQAP